MKRNIFILFFVLSFIGAKSQVAIQYLNGFVWLSDDNSCHLKIEMSDSALMKDLIVVSSDNQTLQPDSVGSFMYSPVDTSNFKFTLYVYKVSNTDRELITSREFSLLPFPAATAEVRIKDLYPRKMAYRMRKSDLFGSDITMVANVLNYDFSISLSVQSFSVMILRNDIMVFDKSYEGEKISENEAKRLKRIVSNGDKVIFYNISVKSNYLYASKYLNSITFKIIE